MTTDTAMNRAKAFCRREGLSPELVPMIAGLIDEAWMDGVEHGRRHGGDKTGFKQADGGYRVPAVVEAIKD